MGYTLVINLVYSNLNSIFNILNALVGFGKSGGVTPPDSVLRHACVNSSAMDATSWALGAM